MRKLVFYLSTSALAVISSKMVVDGTLFTDVEFKIEILFVG